MIMQETSCRGQGFNRSYNAAASSQQTQFDMWLQTFTKHLEYTQGTAHNPTSKLKKQRWEETIWLWRGLWWGGVPEWIWGLHSSASFFYSLLAFSLPDRPRLKPIEQWCKSVLGWKTLSESFVCPHRLSCKNRKSLHQRHTCVTGLALGIGISVCY